MTSIDKGKPTERLGRKTVGPVKWQPVTNMEVFFIAIITVIMRGTS